MIRPRAPALPKGLSLGWYGSVSPLWMPLLDHFSTIEILDRSSAEDYLRDASKDRLLIVGLDDRNDKRLAWLLEMESWIRKTSPSRSTQARRSAKKPAATKKSPTGSSLVSTGAIDSMVCVLGEDWAGHRRTFPLPESVQTFYWNQWYDRLIPWVCWMGGQWNATVGGEVAPLPDSSVAGRAWRIEKDADRFNLWMSSEPIRSMFSQRIAWVVCDQTSHVLQWQGLLEGYGVRSVGTRTDQGTCAIDADLVLLDICDRSADPFPKDGLAKSDTADRGAAKRRISTEYHSLLSGLRNQQPEAFIVAVASFSTMDSWENYRHLGVDAIVARPFSLQGLLCCWGCWLQRHPS
jgi:hypothetical protein